MSQTTTNTTPHDNGSTVDSKVMNGDGSKQDKKCLRPRCGKKVYSEEVDYCSQDCEMLMKMFLTELKTAKQVPVVDEEFTTTYLLNGLSKNDSNLFPSGAVHLVGGASGAGKTGWLLTFLTALDEAKKSNSKIYGRKPNPLPFAIISFDRTRAEVQQLCVQMGIDFDALNFIALRENDLPPAELVAWLNLKEPRFRETKLFVLEGLDLKCDSNDPKEVKPLLIALSKVAETLGLTIIGTVGSPKMKSKDKYANPRDRITGCAHWSRLTSTVCLMELMDPEDLDSARDLFLIPRIGKGDKKTFKWQEGRLLECDEKQEAAKQATKVAEVIAHIEATYSIGADYSFQQSDVRNAGGGKWAAQTFQDAIRKMGSKIETQGAKNCRTGLEYVADVNKFVANLNGEAFTSQQLETAVKAKPVDASGDLVERLFRFTQWKDGRIIGNWSRSTIEKLPEGNYRRWSP